MKKKGQKDKKKSEFKIIFFIILISAVLFIISTYAWFSTQRNVSITNLSGIVEVAEGLEISLDANKWSNGIKLGDAEGEYSIINDAYQNHTNISPRELLPVSTLGLGKGEEKLTFLRGKITNSKELSEIIPMNEQLVLDEQRDESGTIDNSENVAYPGYFAFDIFLKNSSKSTTEDDILQLNYDSSVQVIDSPSSATGLQNTVRVALAKYVGVSDITANQSTILGDTVGTGVDSVMPVLSDVAIWEPNASDHVEHIVTNNNNVTWTQSDADMIFGSGASTTTKFKTTTKMPTYALQPTAESQNIPDIYDWSTGKYIQKQNTLQTTKTSDSDFNISTDDDYTISEGVQDLVSSTDGKTPFTLAPNKISRLRVYVWLEGQDVDCINWASYGGGVKVDIGLVKGSTVGSHEPKE